MFPKSANLFILKFKCANLRQKFSLEKKNKIMSVFFSCIMLAQCEVIQSAAREWSNTIFLFVLAVCVINDFLPS